MRYIYLLLIPLLFSCNGRNPNFSKGKFRAVLTDSTLMPPKSKMEAIPEGYVPPPGTKYTMQYDRSMPPVRLDIAKAIEQPIGKVALSNFAAGISYVRIAYEEWMKYGLQVELTRDGLVLHNVDGAYLYGFDGQLIRKLFQNNHGAAVQESKEGTRTITMSSAAFTGIWQLKYNPSDNALMCAAADGAKTYAGVLSLEQNPLSNEEIPALDVLQNKVPVKRVMGFGNSFMLAAVRDESNASLLSLAMNGDTLCRFAIDREKANTQGWKATRNENTFTYYYDDLYTFRLAGNDTVFRMKDERTLQPLYLLHFGKYRVGRTEGLNPGSDLSEKLFIDEFYETEKYVLLCVNKNYDAPYLYNDGKVTFWWMLYDKTTHTLTPFDKSNKKNGIANDIDGGPVFSPQKAFKDGMLAVYQGIHIKAQEQLAKSPAKSPEKKEKFEEFKTTVQDKDYVIMLVK